MAYQYPYKKIDEAMKRAVWEKGAFIPGYSPEEWRFDICGNIMKYSEHGDTNSENGWEIDHIMPTSLGGTSDLINLQPLHWENNRRKGDNYPWQCW